MVESIARLETMRDMFLYAQQIYSWCLGRDFSLIYSNCPSQQFFYNMFEISFCSAAAEKHFARSRLPVILNDNMGFAWIAAAQTDDRDISVIHLLGPLFTVEASETYLQKLCGKMKLSPDLINELLRQLALVPTIPLNTAIRYGIMLHYSVTGTPVSASHISVAIEASESRDSLEDADWTSSSWHGTWLAEQELFARIKEQTQGKEETQGKENPRTIRMNPWKWAAAIVLPICIAFFTYYLVDSSQTVGAPFIVKADKGDKATIELPDGTNVVLNSASQLSYLNNFGENGRRVQLNGEAYFKVAHDEKRAFIVQVGDLEVKVLGTSFNVSAYEDAKDVTVVLLEGKVGVYAQKTSHIMKPGDKIEYNKATHKITATQVHPSDYIEWTKGNIYFEKESLENIMKTLSRIYDVEIRFDSNKLPNEYFTGTIPGGGIQNALNILMLTSPFYYEMDGSVIVLKEK